MRSISLLVILALIKVTVKLAEFEFEEASVVFVFVEEGDVFDGFDNRPCIEYLVTSKSGLWYISAPSSFVLVTCCCMEPQACAF